MLAPDRWQQAASLFYLKQILLTTVAIRQKNNYVERQVVGMWDVEL